jgi:hypothetical protein
MPSSCWRRRSCSASATSAPRHAFPEIGWSAKSSWRFRCRLALREALVNALCHRDYSLQGAAISLAIFNDRLELWSEGGLPFGLEPEALKREHASRPRNLLIADVF